MRPWSAGIATIFHIETGYDKSPHLGQPTGCSEPGHRAVVSIHTSRGVARTVTPLYRMKILHFIIFSLALVCFGCAHDPAGKRIDARSIETIFASLEGQSQEDATIIKHFVCHSADEFNSPGADVMARTLGALRPRLHGRTVREVVAEITLQQNAAKETLKGIAESFVREKRAKWRERSLRYYLVQPGVAQSRVIELLGEPDAKADSPAVKNWLYRYDAALNDDQVWIATLMVAITEGVVTKTERGFESRGVGDLPKAVK
jgi:hypothetical protein